MHLNDIGLLPNIEAVRARFEKYVHPEPNSGCHIWIGCVDKDGYGKFRINGFDFRAHRVGRALAGKVVLDLPLLHQCDNPFCTNDVHTFHGTQVENIADKMEKGRQAKGERQGAAVLTESDVIAIYSSPEPQTVMAAKYGITQAQVSRIRRAETWAHVTGPLSLIKRSVDCRTLSSRRSS